MKSFNFIGLKCPLPVLKANKILKNDLKNRKFEFLCDDVTAAMIWNSTAIDVSNLIVGFRGEFVGVGSQYNESFQLLVGCQ